MYKNRENVQGGQGEQVEKFTPDGKINESLVEIYDKM